MNEINEIKENLDKQLDIVDKRADKRAANIIGELKSYIDVSLEELRGDFDKQIYDLTQEMNKKFEELKNK